jgi:hypothetical protein
MLYKKMSGTNDKTHYAMQSDADRSVPMTIRSFIAGLSVAALAAATTAPAIGGDKHGKHYNRGWDDRGYGYDYRYDNRGSWYGNNGYYNHYDYDRYSRRKSDNGTALGIGLGVVGLALALSLANSGKNKNRDDRRERRDERYDRDGWYRGDSRQGDGRWQNPDSDDVWAYNQQAYSQFNARDCVQTREYQTRVTVGGRSREAYGTSCLLSNGQWLQGPPQLVPDER